MSRILTTHHLYDTTYMLQIGINYKNTKNQLRGCINDVLNMEKKAIERGNTNCLKMTDNYSGELYPTKRNIMRKLQYMKELSWNGYKNFFIQYSGHGTYLRDSNNDEDDGNDEALVPVDLNLIIDDEFFEILRQFSPISNIFILTDACHSGTNADLPILYENEFCIVQNTKAINAKVIKISGCRDPQTSADTWDREENEYGGALTISFRKFLDLPFKEMIEKIREDLKEKYTQIPQITSSFYMDGTENLKNFINF